METSTNIEVCATLRTAKEVVRRGLPCALVVERKAGGQLVTVVAVKEIALRFGDTSLGEDWLVDFHDRQWFVTATFPREEPDIDIKWRVQKIIDA